MRKLVKILSVLIFPVLLGLIFYIAFSVDYEQPYKIKLIEIKGGEHLSSEKYFTYAGFDKKETYEELTLPIIKSRLEKHPYVKRADVLYSGKGKVEVFIEEKEFWAILLAGANEFVITRDYELLPVLPYTQQILLPIISDDDLFGKLKAFDYVKNNAQLIPAFKVLDAVKMINPVLFDNLSEIAYEQKEFLSVYFTFSDYNLIIDKSKVIDEIYYFNALWKYIGGSEVCENIEYVDLRYSGKIFLGMKNLAEGNKS